MQGGRRSRGVAILLTTMCLVLPDTTVTRALFSGSVAASPGSVTAARIAGVGGETISIVRTGATVSLSWPTVMLDDSRPTESRIMRTGSDGSLVEVCTQADVPVHLGGTDSCSDTTNALDVSYSYTQQPVLRVGGSVTWSVPAGPASVAVRSPRLSWGGAGAIAIANNAVPVTVAYPTSTTVGDVLVLVVRSARNRAPLLPSGWTQIAATISSSPAAAILVAWRIADAAGSVMVGTETNGAGAVAQVVRYVRAIGYTGLPRVATSSPLVATSGASASYTMPGTVPVNVDNAVVIAIATVSGLNPLAASAPGYVLQSTDRATASSTGFGIGFADRNSVDNGAAVGPPAWTQSGVAGAWQTALVAFA